MNFRYAGLRMEPLSLISIVLGTERLRTKGLLLDVVTRLRPSRVVTKRLYLLALLLFAYAVNMI